MNYIDAAFPADPYLRRPTLRTLLASRHLYVVFFLPRSGSTWLTEMAALDGRLGAPQEWFNPAFLLDEEEIVDDGRVTTYVPPKVASISGINDYVTHLANRYASNDGKVAGVELSVDHLEALVERVEGLRSIRRKLSYFYLRRKNIVAQAISLFRSSSSGYWHSYHSEVSRGHYDRVAYDFAGILESLQLIARQELAFHAFFDRYRIFTNDISYEDMLANMPSVLDLMVRAVTGQIGAAPRALKAGKIRKISGPESVDWEETFRSQGAEEIQNIERRRPPFLAGRQTGRIVTVSGSTSEESHTGTTTGQGTKVPR